VLGDPRGPDAKLAPGIHRPQPDHAADLAPAGWQLDGSCLLPTTDTRDLNSVSSHTLTWAACGMVTTTVSGWVDGIRRDHQIGRGGLASSQPPPAQDAVGLHVGPGPKPHHPVGWDQVAGGRLLYQDRRPGDLGISVVGRAPQPRRTHHHLGLGEGLAKASGTSTLSRVVAAGGILAAALVARRAALGVVRPSRPATARVARPTSTIATVTTRLDATPHAVPAASGTHPANHSDRRRWWLDGPPIPCEFPGRASVAAHRIP
jgi:hypothetical protein